MDRRVAGLYVALLVLVFLDAATTLILLDAGGTEVNPVTQWMWTLFGLEKALVGKIGLVLLLGFLIWLAYKVAKTREDVAVCNVVFTGTLLVVTAVYIVVVVNNFYWLYMLTTVMK